MRGREKTLTGVSEDLRGLWLFALPLYRLCHRMRTLVRQFRPKSRLDLPQPIAGLSGPARASEVFSEILAAALRSKTIPPVSQKDPWMQRRHSRLCRLELVCAGALLRMRVLMGIG